MKERSPGVELGGVMKSLVATLALGLVLIASCAVAQDSEQSMPEMGPPPQMEEVKFLVGTWDAVMQSKPAPTDTTWVESKGVAEYSIDVGGAALIMNFSSQMMGMPFQGMMVQCYDRVEKQWESVWTDNMSARLSDYSGTFQNDTSMLAGEEIYEGNMQKTRIMTYNHTDTTFDWQMDMWIDEMNDWVTISTAKYTKRK
jgi:hypothetical protein